MHGLTQTLARLGRLGDWFAGLDDEIFIAEWVIKDSFLDGTDEQGINEKWTTKNEVLSFGAFS